MIKNTPSRPELSGEMSQTSLSNRRTLSIVVCDLKMYIKLYTVFSKILESFSS